MRRDKGNKSSARFFSICPFLSINEWQNNQNIKRVIKYLSRFFLTFPSIPHTRLRKNGGRILKSQSRPWQLRECALVWLCPPIPPLPPLSRVASLGGVPTTPPVQPHHVIFQRSAHSLVPLIPFPPLLRLTNLSSAVFPSSPSHLYCLALTHASVTSASYSCGRFHKRSPQRITCLHRSLS